MSTEPVPFYASRSATNLLLVALTVTVAAGFLGVGVLLQTVLYGLPLVVLVVVTNGRRIPDDADRSGENGGRK